MIVRINDRGPFAKDRIIDLSSRVADMLDVKDQGTAKVEVDYVGPARMDGRDEKMLLASYEGPSKNPIGSMFAWIKPQAKPRADTAPVVYAASAVPMPRVRPDLASYPPHPAEANPLILAPALMPADADPLAPLIMRAGFVNSYADSDTLTPRRTPRRSRQRPLQDHGPRGRARQGRRQNARASSRQGRAPSFSSAPSAIPTTPPASPATSAASAR